MSAKTEDLEREIRSMIAEIAEMDEDEIKGELSFENELGFDSMTALEIVAKLEKRYYGPFQILEKINEAAYRLKLPTHWQIHNAFHVSLLKPYKGEPPMEPIIEDPSDINQDEKIL